MTFAEYAATLEYQPVDTLPWTGEYGEEIPQGIVLRREYEKNYFTQDPTTRFLTLPVHKTVVTYELVGDATSFAAELSGCECDTRWKDVLSRPNSGYSWAWVTPHITS